MIFDNPSCKIVLSCKSFLNYQIFFSVFFFVWVFFVEHSRFTGPLGKGEGYLCNNSLPLPPLLPSGHSRELASAHR